MQRYTPFNAVISLRRSGLTVKNSADVLRVPLQTLISYLRGDLHDLSSFKHRLRPLYYLCKYWRNKRVGKIDKVLFLNIDGISLFDLMVYPTLDKEIIMRYMDILAERIKNEI